ncbi:hypothetical protein JK636_08875 [Clostridium sp. YIM B02515]|uniref:Uncharacterized protein n=1 Tax=Clostridium rhizosphaerae TaxID=2803861 RepID=A0ABS1TAU2_9CLOT|nr:hypothetical protein [Clostridium rhizosphaerae]MBL4935872.1 hypothetical protein [Clostridium rhizosphaerae]
MVLIPVTKPQDTVEAGLLTMSKYKIDSSTRYSFHVKENFLKHLGDLDRCIEENRIPVGGGKELILVNAHLSDYD